MTENVTALYDYEAQADGDLSFSAGDTIEVVTRTENTNEWWVGKIGARQGQFPGNANALKFYLKDMTDKQLQATTCN